MTPAGWYVDPEGTGQLRWWDGTAWTQHRQSPAQMQPQTQTYVHTSTQSSSMQSPMEQLPSMLQQLFEQQNAQPNAQPQFPMARTVIQPNQVEAARQRSPFGNIGTIIPDSESPRQSPLFILVWVGLIGMAVGPFLDWLKLDTSFSSQGVKGTEDIGDGDFWLIGSIADGYVMLGVAALVLLAALVYNGKDSRSAAGWIAVLGIIGAAWTAASFFSFNSKLDDEGLTGAFDLKPAIGMWIAGAGSILVIVGGLASKAAAASATSTQQSLYQSGVSF